MKTNEINRAEIESLTDQFFASGGEVTEVPFGISALNDDGKKRKHADHIALIKARDLAASKARADRK